LKNFHIPPEWHTISCTFAVLPPQLIVVTSACATIAHAVTTGEGKAGHIQKKQKINTIMAKKVNITPLHDRVIVKAAPAEEKTAGGIIIPDTAKEKPQRGVVIAAGPGKKDEPVTVKAGDTVLYGKYAGTEISIEGTEYLIM